MILYIVWDDNGEEYEDRRVEEVYCGLSKDRAEIVAHECKKALCHAAFREDTESVPYGASKHTITIESRDIGMGFDRLADFLKHWGGQ